VGHSIDNGQALGREIIAREDTVVQVTQREARRLEKITPGSVALRRGQCGRDMASG